MFDIGEPVTSGGLKETEGVIEKLFSGIEVVNLTWLRSARRKPR